MVEQIKQRCGVPPSITVYDEEFSQLISDALEEMETAGVPKRLLADLGQDTNPRVLTAAACYVKAHRGSDRTDTDKYMRMYRDKLHKLMLEPDEDRDLLEDTPDNGITDDGITEDDLRYLAEKDELEADGGGG